MKIVLIYVVIGPLVGILVMLVPAVVGLAVSGEWAAVPHMVAVVFAAGYVVGILPAALVGVVMACVRRRTRSLAARIVAAEATAVAAAGLWSLAVHHVDAAANIASGMLTSVVAILGMAAALICEHLADRADPPVTRAGITPPAVPPAPR